MSEIVVWYQFYGENGKPFRNSSCDKIKIDSKADIADFREAIYDKNKEGLPKGILVSLLRVYQRISNVDQGSSSALENVDLSNLELLEVDRLVGGLGDCKANSLVVVVPKGNLDLISS